MTGLGGKTHIVTLTKANIGTAQADGSFSENLQTCLNHLTAGDGTTDLATFTIAGMHIATGVVTVAVQGTGTPAENADFGGSGATSAISVTFEDE